MDRYWVWWLVFIGGFVLQSPVQGAANRGVIEEVIVTAERQEASIQDTSISITALTAESLEQFGIRNQSDFQNLIPSTTIQHWDAAIRGVGRNFRNLGGDPGIATYINDVYSEDLYTAIMGNFWDLERVEVLRGPQGTLYGRNAVGGAMNFIYKEPTDSLEFRLKGIAGNFDTRELYGVISGPLIPDTLNGRLTFSTREHDGYFEERGTGDDAETGEEDNVAIQLQWLINDSMRLKIRHNRADVGDRVIGGNPAGGYIVLRGEDLKDGSRDYSSPTLGYRKVDPAQTNPLAEDYFSPSLEVFTFTNPATGEPILAQHALPGLQPGGDSGMPNRGRFATAPDTECVFLDRSDIKGDDLCVYTNGQNYHHFDQEGTQLEFVWDMSSTVTFKYIFGYNDLMNQFSYDSDFTYSAIDDRQFYVNHEAEYVSHELQLFYDVGTNLTFTSGIFFYDSKIDQRYDGYTTTDMVEVSDPSFAADSIIATLRAMGAPLPPESALPSVPLMYLTGRTEPVDLDVIRQAGVGLPPGEIVTMAGPWFGDATLGSVNHGPVSPGSDQNSANRTVREAFAAYTQAVWDINDRLALTAGIRFAEDDVEGQEANVQYSQTMDPLDALGLSLGEANILRGALDPATLTPTGAVPLWLNGVPISFGLYRRLERVDREVTWRVNLDYELGGSSMVYGNVTTGYRSGGFNLTYFSQTAQFEPEELIAYEVGYKGQLVNNALQLNASAYLYDYESIHTFTAEPCPADVGLSGQSACAVADSTTSVIAAPGAEVYGFEVEVFWLATDRLTFGGNFSYTHSEYDKSLRIIDAYDPETPGTLFDGPEEQAQRAIDIKGAQLPSVPEYKGHLFASYTLPLASGSLEFLGSVSFIDETFWSPYEAAIDRAPGYERLDLRTTWTSGDQRWVVTGFVNNVLDEIGIQEIGRSGNAQNFRRTAQVTEPRVWGLEIMYSMN